SGSWRFYSAQAASALECLDERTEAAFGTNLRTDLFHQRRRRRRSAPLLYFACLIGGDSNWAGGHQPAQCGGRLASLVSLQPPPVHPPSGRNNAHLRFLNRLRRRSDHCFSLRRSCSGSRCDGRLLRFLRSLRGALCLRLPRRSIFKVAKRSCENVTGPQEEINFSVKLSDYFCT